MTADSKPFDRTELLPCAFCKRGVAHDGNVVFYEIVTGQCLLDFESIRQQHGLELVIGAPALAAALAPSTNVAHRLPASRKLVCSQCAMESMPLICLIADEE